MRKIIYPIVSLIIALSSCSTSNLDNSVTSPNGKVKIGLSFNEQSQPLFSVHFNENEVVKPSVLALKMKENGLLSEGLEVISSSAQTIDETYEVYAGKSTSAHNHCNEKTFVLKEKTEPGREVHLVFRAYDDGIAFRYIVPNQESISNYNLSTENTQFYFNEAATFWCMHLGSHYSAYEAHYRETKMEDLDEKSIIGFPVTFKIGENVAGCLSDARLKNYAGTYLKQNPTNPESFITNLIWADTDTEVSVFAEEELVTPWRALMLAENENELITSNLIMNLNDPCEIQDPSWIKPGKAAWDWLCYQKVPEDAGFESGMNNETMKYFIDFAGEYGFEYMMIDAGWYGDHQDVEADITTCIDGFDIEELVVYAKKQNVDIWLWLNWKNFDKQLEESCKKYKEWDIKGVKVDYLNGDHQSKIDFYWRAAEMTAKYNLMIDYHGCYKPTGMRRTWPNVITREGIYGLEQARAGGNLTPVHNVTIPFTRMLVGPMDYTPGSFNNVKRKDYVVYNEPPTAFGSRAHHLAQFVVYESPFQMVADWPGAYRQGKGSEFLKVVPASWDETYPVDGKIGEYVVLARKLGNDWFLGAMSDWKAIDIKPLNPENLFNEEGKQGSLTGRYFNGDNFDEEKFVKEDAKFDFSWGGGSPEGLNSDHFSIRWTGKIKAERTGQYTFITESDDGVRLWVNGEKLVDEWRKQAPFPKYAYIDLEKGKEYDIKIEYYDQTSGASFKINMIPPSENQKEEGEWHHREISVPLDFLEDGNSYQATIYHDIEANTDNPKEIGIETKQLKKGDQLTIQMAEGGGMAVHFAKK